MYRSKHRGVVTVEFALGFMLFWTMLIAWVEVSYMSYVTAISDLAISEASRSAKTETDTYITAFYQVLNDSNSIWKSLVDESNFTATVQFIGSIDDLTNFAGVCAPADGQQTASCGTETNSTIAIYSISYEYTSLFSQFIDSSVFSREVLVVQEYERDQFQI
ncbi:TadE family protein [Vibrio sp. SCSIO 43136]|uniref:TadE/TadG family type IV pilus assembly protein n=1 Tax=Vibrio sp. SCSIO 43136 TaxID=2819101 RepID=UPI002075077E|nr:TadE family protein [Vibrio sp. SCSIO 43136]USD64733.1 pilus assembly protein [Vibrio sp. SCSIO 43136]